MAASGARRKPAGAELEQLRAELAETRAALQVVARVAANVAAKCAPVRWTDFQRLLTDQYGVTHADAELFREILAGRKP